MLFIAKLGTDYLASAALATMFANVSGFSFAIGMSTALETLCSQSHTGSSDRHSLGKHLQRAFLVIGLLCIPIACSWAYSESLLLFFGQDSLLAKLSGQYLIRLIPSLFAISAAECLERYLQAQAIMNAPLLVLLVLSPINLLLHYLLILHPSTAIGFLGAPIASCTISYLILCCYVLYIRFVQGGAAWGGFSIDALNISMMWEFIRLGVPGVIMLASEWWAFEIMALIAGILGKNSLAAQSILMSTYSLTYMIPLGISVACTSVVGNALGAGDQRMAQLASRASLALGLSIGFFIGVVLFLVRHQWSYLWNDDQEVAQLVATIIPFLSFFQLSDAISAICNSVFLGTGKQKLGAVMNIAAYYVLGLPLGWYLAFHPMGMTGLMGMWVGLESALLVLSIVQMGFIITLDWNHEVLVAKQRLSLENEGYSPISIHDEEEAFFDAE